MNTPPTDTAPPDETATQKEIRDLERQTREQRARAAALDEAATVRRRRSELARAKQDADVKQILTNLEEEHGELGKKIAYAKTEKGLIVVKRAPGVVWHRWKNSKMRDADDEEFVRRCLIHPSEDEFDAIIDEECGVIQTLILLLTKLYGFKREEEAGK